MWSLDDPICVFRSWNEMLGQSSDSNTVLCFI